MLNFNKDFSVLMSIYKKESASFFKMAMDSVLDQTLMPSEIVLVKDGPLTEELNILIDEYVLKHQQIFNIVVLEENKGLGKALNIGVLNCSNDIIARMDTDDICNKYRFEKQILFLLEHPSISIIGSWINEFGESVSDLVGVRRVPEFNKEIVSYQKNRNAMNHMTVVFRKEKVLEAGNYKSMLFFEDYYLWVRMMLNNSEFYNIQESLVYARVGNNMVGRRHGLEYAKNEYANFIGVYKLGFINIIELAKLLLVRLPVRLLPKKLILFVYKNVIRVRETNQ